MSVAPSTIAGVAWTRQQAAAESDDAARFVRIIDNQIERLEAERRMLEERREHCREQIARAETQHQFLEALAAAAQQRDHGQELLDMAIETALEAGVAVVEISRVTGVARSTLYRRHGLSDNGRGAARSGPSGGADARDEGRRDPAPGLSLGL